jgi:pimeloyl-ACP methyl ester carboxylesterase
VTDGSGTGTRTARNGDVEIVYETIGPADAEPLLLVMGQGGQLISWPDGFCLALVEQGFQVARFDNRDAGCSTHFSHAAPPNRLTMRLRPAAAAGYRLEDMAGDALAVMDALGWDAAHVLGVSMGAMIGQVLAVTHPTRVRGLVSVMSTPSWRIGLPSPWTLVRVSRVVGRRVRTVDDAIRQAVDLARICRSPGYPFDEELVRATARLAYQRGHDPDGIQRHTAAIAAAGDRRPALAAITAPTLVLHGEDDPMIRPAGGKATARAIPGARLRVFPGWGHDLPSGLWPTIGGEIRALADSARSRGPA